MKLEDVLKPQEISREEIRKAQEQMREMGSPFAILAQLWCCPECGQLIRRDPAMGPSTCPECGTKESGDSK